MRLKGKSEHLWVASVNLKHDKYYIKSFLIVLLLLPFRIPPNTPGLTQTHPNRCFYLDRRGSTSSIFNWVPAVQLAGRTGCGCLSKSLSRAEKLTTQRWNHNGDISLDMKRQWHTEYKATQQSTPNAGLPILHNISENTEHTGGSA